MLEIETSEVLGDNQIAHRDARAFRDYQLWAGEVRPKQSERARRVELIGICKGVAFNRDQVDALEDNLRDPVRARRHVAYDEEFNDLEVPAADPSDPRARVEIIAKVDDLMAEFDAQSGGIM